MGTKWKHLPPSADDMHKGDNISKTLRLVLTRGKSHLSVKVSSDAGQGQLSLLLEKRTQKSLFWVQLHEFCKFQKSNLLRTEYLWPFAAAHSGQPLKGGLDTCVRHVLNQISHSKHSQEVQGACSFSCLTLHVTNSLSTETECRKVSLFKLPEQSNLKEKKKF